ncbi:uncharacterized protein LOC129947352 [Eupeodes corollae]|uniref:uncharacterized protein LOC129947352 n=1 Tax=Eupeodes corollae TaxID=290404 RepID=UPI0024919DAA|nr:uncharacterized protein LOC129947352 [Eupeodes corollae]
MKLQAVLVLTLLSVLVMNIEGKILKKLLKKKLALIPILAGAKHKLGSGNGSGHRGSNNELIVPQADNSFGQTTSQQSHLIDESSLVEQVHPVPASVAVYSSYAPEFRAPTVYYRAAQPVVRRTVYEYVKDSSRNNDNVETLSGNSGSSSTPSASNIPNISSIPGLSNIPGISGILGLSNILGVSNLSGLQSIKNVASRTLTGLATSLQQPIQAPRPASPTVTTYVSYPPYY